MGTAAGLHSQLVVVRQQASMTGTPAVGVGHHAGHAVVVLETKIGSRIRLEAADRIRLTPVRRSRLVLDHTALAAHLVGLENYSRLEVHRERLEHAVQSRLDPETDRIQTGLTADRS